MPSAFFPAPKQSVLFEIYPISETSSYNVYNHLPVVQTGLARPVEAGNTIPHPTSWRDGEVNHDQPIILDSSRWQLSTDTRTVARLAWAREGDELSLGTVARLGASQ